MSLERIFQRIQEATRKSIRFATFSVDELSLENIKYLKETGNYTVISWDNETYKVLW